MVNQSYLNMGRAGDFHVVNECEISDTLAKSIRLRAFHLNDLQSSQSCFCFGLRSYSEHKLILVKQFTDIPINRGPFKERTEIGSNYTVLVFLQYVISSLMHQKEIDHILTYRKTSKSESCTSSSFSRHWQCYMSVILSTPGHPLTLQDALLHPRTPSIWLESHLFCSI